MLWSAQRSAARRMLSPRLPSGRFYFKPVRYTDRLEALLPSKQSVPAYRLLSPDGTLCSSYKPDRRLATALYRSMTRWSVFDAVMNDAQRQGRISFYLTSSGEEAVSYGSASALQADDIVYAQYREGGVLEWRRYPMQSLVDQCFGNERDAGKGRQMPVHYGSAEHFYHTVSSPLGTQIPQAAGAGYRLRLDSPSRIAICYFGEGAASEGDFHAGMNFAAVLGCHTLFLCRNNEWAISTPLSEQYSGDGIVVRGPAYGMAAFRVDGNDVFAVHEAVRQARQMIIGEHRPVLIEAMTYRLGHHSTSDDSYAYRDREEVAQRAADHPIDRLRRFLESRKWSDPVEDAEYREQCRANVIEMIKDAESVPKPNVRSMFEDVYDVMPPHLEEQHAKLTSILGDEDANAK